MKIFKRWIKQDKGATSIEYGLIAVGVAVAIAVVVFTLGNEVRDLFFVKIVGALNH